MPQVGWGGGGVIHVVQNHRGGVVGEGQVDGGAHVVELEALWNGNYVFIISSGSLEVQS